MTTTHTKAVVSFYNSLLGTQASVEVDLWRIDDVLKALRFTRAGMTSVSIDGHHMPMPGTYCNPTRYDKRCWEFWHNRPYEHIPADQVREYNV